MLYIHGEEQMEKTIECYKIQRGIRLKLSNARIKNKAFSSGIMLFDIVPAPVLEEELINNFCIVLILPAIADNG